MRRELRFGLASLRRKPLLALLGWSVPEALPTAFSGFAVTRAVDDGFLAGAPAVGFGWLSGLMLMAGLGALGSRNVFRRLGDLVEPFRDELVRRVVGGALRRGVAGRPDPGALARLTRQVEVVRDTYSGLIMVVRGFVVTVVGVVLGLLSVSPVVAVLILPPFLLGFVVFVATLGMAASRQRASVHADERLAETAGVVLAGARDVVLTGAEEHAARLVDRSVTEQAAAERGLATVSALRTVCFAIGGGVPLLAVLVAGPWLVGRGLTAGEIMGGLTYVLVGLQPALQTFVTGIGGSGLRFVVTLGRVLDASPRPVAPPPAATARGYAVTFQDVSFAYGPHSEPVLRGLDLTIGEGEHVAIVGPSGIGKSTVAGLVCGLLRPTAGQLLLGGVPAAERAPASRVLIPQEAYVFTGTVRDNLSYLRPEATSRQLDRAVMEVGAGPLVDRLGGYAATLRPAELSAGERQLIALVRAYVSAASVVVLDEATCHLDPVAERTAEEAFAGWGDTVIVIAHRISSALRADRIVVLDGAGVTVGDHESLLSDCALYRELVGHWHAGSTTASSGSPATRG